MEKSKLVRYLFTLTQSEWARFELFLHSPYFNRKKLVVELFNFLKPFRKGWQWGEELPEISREKAFAALYGQEEFRRQRLRRVAMELMELLLEFIAQEGPKALPENFLREFSVQKHLLDRGNMDMYQERREELDPKDLNGDFNSMGHLLKMFMGRLHNEYFIHAGQPEDSIEEVVSNLDRFWMGSRLEMWTSMANRQQIYSSEHEFTFEKEFVAMLNSETAINWSTTQLWRNLFQLQREEKNEEVVRGLEMFLSRNSAILPLAELRQVRGFMLNHLNRTEVESRAKYQKLWLLLKAMLEEGTLYAQGKINSPLFRATVRAACLSGNWTWATNFLHEHGANLKGKEREEQLELFHAMADFHAGLFNNARKRLAKIRFKSIRNEVYLKSLQIMCVYELEFEEDFFRKIEAFRKYVFRAESLGEKFSRRYLLFIRLGRRLGKTKFLKKELRPGLAQEISREKTAEAYWLLQQCQALQQAMN